MPESLYVCEFSNGTVKVGRSRNAPSRVRQHHERVAVLGVTVSQWQEFPCKSGIAGAESWLIRACELVATSTRGNEWFEGLSFAQACALASEACKQPDLRNDDATSGARPDFKAVVRALTAAGYRQTELARLCGIAQSSLSDIANGVTSDPSYSVGYVLMQLLAEARSTDLTSVVNERLAA